MGDVIVLIFGLALAVATVFVLLRQGEVPQRLARRKFAHHGRPEWERPQVTEPPAGPDAEDTAVAGPGQPVPRSRFIGDEEVR